jgi:uncharacterized membrane protein YjjP (DUF1212 family)
MTERENTFDQACDFLMEVGKAAHSYGSSGSRIESYLAHLAPTLGVRGTFRITPTDFLSAFSKEDSDSWQRLELEDLPPSGWNLNRLAALGEVAAAVEDGQASVAEATKRMDAIKNLPDPWGTFLVGASFLVAGAGFATMIGGSVWDVITGGILGLIVFFTMALIGRYGGQRAGEWLPFIAALVTGALVAVARVVQPEINPIVSTVCAVIILVPGYAVSIGILELLSNRVVSGMANLMNGLLYLAKLIAGAWLGYALVTLVLSVPEVTTGQSVGILWLFIALVPMLAALCFAFQTPRRDVFMTIVIVGVSFLVMFLIGAVVPAIAGVFLGTLFSAAVGVILANLWNRRTGRPTSIILAPLAMLLVSGSVGFRGLATITTGQTALGVEQFLQMFIIAIAVGAGLLVGNAIVEPKKAL